MEKDYIELGTTTPLKIFSAKLAKKMQEHMKTRKPFDEPCARIDFKDQIDALERESERRNGFIDPASMKIDLKDFDKYGDEDRFDFVEDQEDVTEKFVDGTRTRVVLGHTVSYKCKQRGHGVSVFIPQEEYLELKKETPTKGEEKNK